jgi:hypothetical protein
LYSGKLEKNLISAYLHPVGRGLFGQMEISWNSNGDILRDKLKTSKRAFGLSWRFHKTIFW